MSDAYIGIGTVIAYGDGGVPTELFTAFAEVIEFDPPAEVVEFFETTNFGSANRTKEYKPGLIEPGEFTMTLAFVPGGADSTVIQGLRGAAVNKNYRITWKDEAGADAYYWTVSAALQTHKAAAPIGDRMTLECVFKVSGSYIEAAVI